MSKNTHYNQKPKVTPLFDETETIKYPGCEPVIIRTVTRGKDPKKNNRETKITENHLQPNGPCINPWDLHQSTVLVTIGFTGNLANEETLLCNQCLEHNNELIDHKAKWRIPYIYDPKTY